MEITPSLKEGDESRARSCAAGEQSTRREPAPRFGGPKAPGSLEKGSTGDLATQVENAFQSIAFLIGAYGRSQLLILRSPVRGPIRLFRRYSNPETREIGPYSALFVSMVIAYAVVTAPSSLGEIGSLVRDTLRSPARTGVWTWLAASFISVVAVDFYLRGMAASHFRTDQRRRRRFVVLCLYVISPVVLLPFLLAALIGPLVSRFTSSVVVLLAAACASLLSIRGLGPIFWSASQVASRRPPHWLQRLPPWLLSRGWLRANSLAGSAVLPLGIGLVMGLASLGAAWIQRGDMHLYTYCDVVAADAAITGSLLIVNDRSDDILVEAQAFHLRGDPGRAIGDLPIRLISDGSNRALPSYPVKAGEEAFFKFASSPFAHERGRPTICQAEIGFGVTSLGVR